MKKIIFSIKRLLIPMIRFIASIFSHLFKIKPLILLESYPDFTDNTFVVFETMIEQGVNKHFKIVWMVSDESLAKQKIGNLPNVSYFVLHGHGLKAKLAKTIKSFVLFSQAKYYIFSNRPLSKGYPKKGQEFVYLTHGIGLKNWKSRAFSSKFFTKIVASSSYTGTLLSVIFDEIDSKFLLSGYPRNEQLVAKNETLETSIRKAFGYGDKNLIVWMPTYRNHVDGLTNDSSDSSSSDLPILTDIAMFESLNTALETSNTYLVIKPHPSQDISKFNLIEQSNIKLLTNAMLAKETIQLYSLLSITSALITDYSSVYFDYLLCDRPIGFTFEDIESYGKKVGFVVENPKSLMPGHEIVDFEDFLNFVETYREDSFKEQRQALKHKIMDDSLDPSKASLTILETLGIMNHD